MLTEYSNNVRSLHKLFLWCCGKIKTQDKVEHLGLLNNASRPKFFTLRERAKWSTEELKADLNNTRCDAAAGWKTLRSLGNTAPFVSYQM